MKNAEKRVFLALLGIFLLGMMLVSVSTSPLYQFSFGGDSAIFTLIGKGIVNGKIPYVDLFDHKGPILFGIEALGYGVGGRAGIFLLQCVFGCITLFGIYKIYIMFSEQGEQKTKDLFLIFIPVYAMFFYTFEGGNLTEEYSLPFIASCIYLMMKYAMNVKNKEEHSPVYAFYYGICFGILAFIRVNNAVSICAGILAIAVFLVIRKKYKNLLSNILCGLLGILFIALPVSLYFAVLNAWDDMIYATFIHNIRYAAATSSQSIFADPLKSMATYLPVVLSLICLISFGIELKREKRKAEFVDVVIGCMLICNFMCQAISNSYAHYFAIYVPVFLLVLTKYKNEGTKVVKAIKITMLVLSVMVSGFFVAKSTATAVYNGLLTSDYRMQHEKITEAFSVIPENERDSVIGYNIHARVYMNGDIIPCYKYYTFQKWWSVSNPAINEEFMKWLEEEKPLWVVKHPGEKETKLMQILEEDYELKNESKALFVYRLKEK